MPDKGGRDQRTEAVLDCEKLFEACVVSESILLIVLDVVGQNPNFCYRRFV